MEPPGAVARRGLVGCAGYEPLRSREVTSRRRRGLLDDPPGNMSSVLRQAKSTTLPVLAQVEVDVPVVVWVTGLGEDAVCPSCRQSTLLRNVPPDSAFDFAVRCARCGAVSEAPAFPPGRGLSGMRYVVPPGENPSANAEAAYGVVVIGQPGVDGRELETRYGFNPPGTKRELGPAGIQETIEEARSVFADILPALERRHERGASPTHRLPQLVATLEENLAEVEAGGREINVLAAVELHAASFFVGRWSRDPSLPRLLQESTSATTFDHNVLLLALASVLEDAGLGPELVVPENGRSPDLRLRVGAHTVVELDVKAPVALQRRPYEGVPPREARSIIDAAITDSRGQFATTALLVVAGAFWASDFDEHAAAASAALSRRLPANASEEARRHRENLCGVILASTTVQLARAREAGPFTGKWSEIDWTSDREFRWVPNPQYKGAVELSFALDLSTFEGRLPAPGTS